MDYEPIYMRTHVLAPTERRLFALFWLVGMVAWLGSFAAFVYTGQSVPWFALSVLGGVVAVVFGMAVRYRVHLFPWWWRGAKEVRAEGAHDVV